MLPRIVALASLLPLLMASTAAHGTSPAAESTGEAHPPSDPAPGGAPPAPPEPSTSAVGSEPLVVVSHLGVTETARFARPGAFDLEVIYRSDFDDLPTQSTRFVLKATPARGQEFRLGWDAWGRAVPSIGDPVSGAGAPFAVGRFAIPLDVLEPERHRLAVRVELSPRGWSQAPFSGSGLLVSGAAQYTTWRGPLRYSARAGADSVLGGDVDIVDLPLSGAVQWQPLPWLEVGWEFVERLRLNDLNGSQTSLDAWVAWPALDGLWLDLSGTVGLSETLPDASLRLGLTTSLGSL